MKRAKGTSRDRNAQREGEKTGNKHKNGTGKDRKALTDNERQQKHKSDKQGQQKV